MATPKQIRRRGRFALVTAVLVGALTVTGIALGYVATDQPDYAPGSVVTISGGNDASGLPGYVVGNTVDVVAAADNGLWEQTCSATVAADETWSCTVTLSSDPAIAVGSYHYTASSIDANGNPISETGTFTDATLKYYISSATLSFFGNGSTCNSGSSPFANGTDVCTDAEYTVAVTNGNQDAELYLWWIDPSSTRQFIDSVTGLDATGTFHLKAHHVLTTAGTWTVKACISDTACTGANLITSSTFTINAASSDQTPPTTTITLDPSSPNGSNGWYTSAVTVTVASADSDVASTRCVLDPVTVPASFDDLPASCAYTGSGASVSSEGQHTVYAASIDTTGNKESIKSASFKIDTTAPSLSLSLTESDAYDYVDTATNTLYYNDQGTNTGSFTVTGTASDTVSGIDKVNFPNVFTAGDGADDTSSPYSNAYNWTATENVSGSQTVTAYNGAGLTQTASFTVTRDVTAPSISVTGFTDGAIYHPGDTLPTAGCSTATDGGSGVASQSGPSVKSGTGLINGLGTVTYQCTATDNVGNSYTAESTYSVIYDFTGFFQPVDNNGVCNVAKAGSAIPIKFSLDGYQGMDIIATGYPKALNGTCTSGFDPIEELSTATAGNSTLNYDATTDQYIYVWKTQKAWAGKAIKFDLGLVDGTHHYARFTFTK